MIEVPCSGLTRMFFSFEVDDILAAQEVCAGCAQATRCLSGARRRRESSGVWGGQLFQNGKVIRVRQPVALVGLDQRSQAQPAAASELVGACS
jgi:WhiB family redox-sensing transcriptional regulator